MTKLGSLNHVASLTLIFTIIISTLSTLASSTKDIVIDYPPDHDYTILPGGIRICSPKDYIKQKNLLMDETAYILMNQTVTLTIGSLCFKEKYSIMFQDKKWDHQKSKNILKVESTMDGLVISSENEIDYSKNDLMEINSVIEKCSAHNLKHILTIKIFEKCDLDFEKKDVDLCNVNSDHYKISNSMIKYSKKGLFDKIVIKPISTTITIKTSYCNEQDHITTLNPRDFTNNLNVMDNWYTFDYTVKKSLFSTGISISISGILIDHWYYKEPECDELPVFIFIGAKDLKKLCNVYDDLFTNHDDLFTNHDDLFTNHYDYTPVYTTERRVVNFPYLIIILMIILGKAMCGYGVYKRRQARLITFTTRRIVDHFEEVSPVGSNIITIVSANQQSGSQSHSQRQPSEDLPPAYNDLQHTDSNPPGYEDACKSKFVSPPEYEDACRDNEGYEIEIETSSSNNITESMEANQVSTTDGRTISQDLN